MINIKSRKVSGYQYIKTCLNCRAQFSAKKPFAKYCSLYCKSMFYKSNHSAKASLKKLYKERYLPNEVSNIMKNWIEVSEDHISIVLENAYPEETVQKLKELGYEENLPIREISFSSDGNVLILKNLMGKYNIITRNQRL
jgi:hypothetical protein